ncbi:hypothetical protein PTT_10479 [Pyrenophora teres f. teres 0-1]|uniref:Secreted protein n=1 Tax=Pyrenophora teres f. teres (strain 0-1) TaxID=861557 RepID=E3RPC5_PYRTT|nr:hypothetical protein PTT_10479 [Pyrenophora teres f. teres 0-1]
MSTRRDALSSVKKWVLPLMIIFNWLPCGSENKVSSCKMYLRLCNNILMLYDGVKHCTSRPIGTVLDDLIPAHRI